MPSFNLPVITQSDAESYRRRIAWYADVRVGDSAMERLNISVMNGVTIAAGKVLRERKRNEFQL